MPSRAQVKVYRPKRSEAYHLCKQINDGQCSCIRDGKNPCAAWLMPLRHCYAHGLDPVAYERDRLRRQERI